MPQLEVEIGGQEFYGEYCPATKKTPDESCPENLEPQKETLCCPSGLFLGPGETCYERYSFELSEGQSSSQVVVELSNSGGENLQVTGVYLEEGASSIVSLLWDGGGTDQPPDFPITLEPGPPADWFSFVVNYTPVVGFDYAIAPRAVLVIESNDPRYDKGDYQHKYKVLISRSAGEVGVAAELNRKNITYGCVADCSSEKVTIDNQGTDTLVISKMDFEGASSEFLLFDLPELPVEIPPEGDPGHGPLTFSVQYCPADDYYHDTNVLLITTNDMRYPDGVIALPLKVVQATAILEFSGDSPLSYLDFREEKVHSVIISNKAASECDELCPDKGQCCGCPIQIKGVDMEPADLAQWYTVTARNPVDDSVLSLPCFLGGGAAIEFEVAYQKPAGQSEDRTGTLCIWYVSPSAGPQSYCVNLMAKKQCALAIAPVNQVLHFNSASPSEVKEKPVVLYNTGAAPCTVTSVKLTDKWGDASEDFSLKKPFAGNTQLPPFSLEPVWIQYSPHSTDLIGKLGVTYVDGEAGQVDTTVSLIGTKEQGCKLAVADPGTPDAYAGATAEQTMSLDGCSSSPGSCGDAIFESGYIWFLLSRPEDSTVMLNTEGTCMTSFQPDVPGEYEIGLMVYDKVAFLQSDLATVKFTAKAAE